jgi:hypothetical protein
MEDNKPFVLSVLIRFVAYSALACLLFQIFVFGKTKIPIGSMIIIVIALFTVLTIGNYYLFVYTKRRKK